MIKNPHPITAITRLRTKSAINKEGNNALLLTVIHQRWGLFSAITNMASPDLDYANQNGQTLLYLLIQFCNFEAATNVTEAGAPEAADKKRLTPLLVANRKHFPFYHTGGHFI